MITKESASGELYMSLASNLRKLRVKHGLSQTDLSDAIGVSYSRISEMENGRANPKLSTLEALANVFGVTVSELVRERGRKLQKSA